MLAPSEKLIVWFALVAGGAALATAVAPSLAAALAMLLAVLALLVVGDAVWGCRRRDEIAASVATPVRMTAGRPAGVEVSLAHRRQSACELRVGLDFPPAAEAPVEGVAIRLADGSSATGLTLPCRIARRGLYVLRWCCLERRSPMGWWQVRRRIPIACELRVYPNLLAGNAALSALFPSHPMVGLHTRRQVGRGREFEGLRDYLPGDGYDEVYWKATARRGRPITKIFQVETTQQVYVALDCSRLSARCHGHAPPSAASTPESALDRCVAAALATGLAAERQGDRFGLATFSDQLHEFLPARAGKSHYGMCRDRLYRQEPRLVNPDFADLATQLRLRVRRRALIVVLTSLDNPVLAEMFREAMTLLRDRHLVLVNVIRPRDATPLFSDPPAGNVAEGYRQLAAHLRWADIHETGVALKRDGIDFALLEDERFCVAAVQRYLDVKRRQIL